MPLPDWTGLVGALGLIALGAVLGRLVNWASHYVGDLKRANEALHQVNDRLLVERDALKARIEQAEGQSRHSLPQLAVSSTAEVLGFEFIKLKEQLDVVEAQMANTQMKIAWMRNGGHPDANWNEIVKFWNARKNGG
jgi:hypothetical protein